AAFGDANAANGKPVSVSGISIAGTDAGNYTSNTMSATTADITPKTATGHFSVADRNYDGGVVAGITARSLTDVVGGDDVTLIGGAATFDNKHVGTGKTVTGTGFSLGGTAAGNYSLASN